MEGTKLKENERTLQFRKNFMRLYEEGLTALEIGEKYNLSSGTVYRILGEIAEEAGVTRESLLQRPHYIGHIFSSERYGPVEKVDLAEFERHFKTAREEIDKLVAEVNNEIKRQQKLANKVYQEEERWQQRR